MSHRTVFTMLLAFTLLSCSTGGEKGELIVYSARHYDADELLYEAFEKKTGIKVSVTEDKGDALMARLKDENAPGDVFITVDAGNLWAADQAGLFAPVQSSVLEERVPAHLRHAGGHWFGFSMRARCLYYHRDRVRPEQLSSYEALATPAWKGKVLIRSSSNVYNQSLVGSLISNLGAPATELWAKGIVSNMARTPQGGDTDQIRAVAAGEGDVSIGNSYYYARLLKSKKPEDQAVVEKVDIFFPNQGDRGTHVNISGAGMLARSANPDAARQFLEFLASDEAQDMFASGNNEFPVVAGATVDPVIAPWTQNRFDTATRVDDFGSRTAEALQLMDRAGWR